MEKLSSFKDYSRTALVFRAAVKKIRLVVQVTNYVNISTVFSWLTFDRTIMNDVTEKFSFLFMHINNRGVNQSTKFVLDFFDFFLIFTDLDIKYTITRRELFS